MVKKQGAHPPESQAARSKSYMSLHARAVVFTQSGVIVPSRLWIDPNAVAGIHVPPDCSPALNMWT